MTQMSDRLIVKVVTRDLTNPDLPPREKEVNYLNRSDRKWLSGHCTWAMNHKHSVTTYPI